MANNNRHESSSHLMISSPWIKTVCLHLSTTIAPSSIKWIWSKWLNIMKQMYLLTINRKHIYASFKIVLPQFSALWWSNKQEVISLSFGFADYFSYWLGLFPWCVSVWFLFWVCIWKHFSFNGPLVRLRTTSFWFQKESGHPTIHGHMQNWGSGWCGKAWGGKGGFGHEPLTGSMT